MEVCAVADLLESKNLDAPVLNALVPNEENYTTLFFQPEGPVTVSSAGVKNSNETLADRQYREFLTVAIEKTIDLAVTPEYSMPWHVLREVVEQGSGPAPGKLWVLGCESITYEPLADLRDALSNYATVIFEELEPDTSRFLNPLAYVFRTGKENELIILVQFKTHPLSDDTEFEINHMQRGRNVYQFGDGTQSIRLLTLICSDAFNFTEEIAKQTYDRTLFLHVQLNPKPNHDVFHACRQRVFRLAGAQTEVVCLNWAAKLSVQNTSGQETCWNNIAGSGWYLKPNRFDTNDATLSRNHRRGLYYTYLEYLRTHALFFHYAPAIFCVTASKVAQIGIAAPLARRRGPQLDEALEWDHNACEWRERAVAEDGFSFVSEKSGRAKPDLETISGHNPFNVERLLALSGGYLNSADWYNIVQLDSCRINRTEKIRRVTVCQDTASITCNFRSQKLRRCAHLYEILSEMELPTPIEDVSSGFELAWDKQHLHHNIRADKGRCTVIYLGENADKATAIEMVRRVSEYLRVHYSDPDQRLVARQRVAVFYRDLNGKVQSEITDWLLKIDKDEHSSEFGITRDE